MLAEHDLLRSGEGAEMTFVDLLGLDVEREMAGEVLLDGGGIVAEVAAVGLAVDHGIGIGDVGLVDRVELVIHAAALRHGRKSLRRLMLRVVLHMRQQGPCNEAVVEKGKNINQLLSLPSYTHPH